MKTKELVRDAFLAAILLVLQVSLSWLPNVELVSLLLILYTPRIPPPCLVHPLCIRHSGGTDLRLRPVVVFLSLCVGDPLRFRISHGRERKTAFDIGCAACRDLRYALRAAVRRLLLLYRRHRSRVCMVDSRHSLRHRSRHQQLCRHTPAV